MTPSSLKKPAAVATAAVAVAAAAAGCGSSGSQPVAARQGNIEIVHPFVPAPASPSVAAVYLTVRDVGAEPDSLQGGTTPAATTSELMTERADTMAPLAALPVPAHGQAALEPGRSHLMLDGLTGSLRAGQTISVTLHFARSGAVAVQVPVVRMTDPMANMPGMRMGN